jgi:hypothetical protein
MKPTSPFISQNSVIHLIRVAVDRSPGSSGASRPITIYGKCEQDLENSNGPVPITFSLDPPPVVSAEINEGIMSRTNRQLNTASVVSQKSGAISGSLPSKASTDLDIRGSVIPRANFFPRVPSSRPRSRSFSGFDMAAAEMKLSIEPR